jgi:hypothetical protein
MRRESLNDWEAAMSGNVEGGIFGHEPKIAIS